MGRPRIVLVAAVAADGGIGRGRELLFREPQDQKHFSRYTMGKPVVMGRLTWESLPARFRPLPGRRNVVLTRDAGYAAAGAETAPDLAAALARLEDQTEVCVIGGGQVFAEALPRADALVLTEIGRRFDGTDSFFPAFDRGAFTVLERREAVAQDGTPMAFVTYERRG